MKWIKLFVFFYGVACCVSCPIHMWRYRKDKDAVMLYGLMFLMGLFFILAYWM